MRDHGDAEHHHRLAQIVAYRARACVRLTVAEEQDRPMRLATRRHLSYFEAPLVHVHPAPNRLRSGSRMASASPASRLKRLVQAQRV